MLDRIVTRHDKRFRPKRRPYKRGKARTTTRRMIREAQS